MGPDFVIPQERIDPERDPGIAARVGGKALALAAMARAGIAVPPFVAVATDAYVGYLEATGLRARIGFELERKDLATCAGRRCGTRRCASATSL